MCVCECSASYEKLFRTVMRAKYLESKMRVTALFCGQPKMFVASREDERGVKMIHNGSTHSASSLAKRKFYKDKLLCILLEWFCMVEAVGAFL